METYFITLHTADTGNIKENKEKQHDSDSEDINRRGSERNDKRIEKQNICKAVTYSE